MKPSEAFRDAIWKANNYYMTAIYQFTNRASHLDFAKMIERNKRLYVIECNNRFVTVGMSNNHILYKLNS